MASGMFTNTWGTSVSVASNSCADVMRAADSYQALSNPAWVARSCTADPVAAGTVINFVNGLNGALATWTTQAISATAATPAAGPISVSVTVQPYRASSDDYAAVSVIFGSILLAACLIWGAKQLLNLLRTSAEA